MKPRQSQTYGRLLDQLEAARHEFDRAGGDRTARLLSQVAKCEFSDPHELIRFHECLLFLRAFPRSAPEVAKVEGILNGFHRRIEKFRDADFAMSAFDDFDTSGIAGTTMQDTLSLEVATWLERRFPENVEVAWDDYWEDHESERARCLLWPNFIPLLKEDADVEATIPWRSWLDAARGRKNSLAWLVESFAKMPLPGREQAELFGSLRLPIRWKAEGRKLSRTGNYSRPRRFFFHNGPLIRRNEVSLARELAAPTPTLKKLSVASSSLAIEALREFMLVRYRELYGATFGDPRTVVRADLGRGVVLYLWGILPSSRLPLRAYVCGYCMKNGVAINYFEAIGLCEWMEIGFNTFYTYRQGETAWVYAQILRCLNAFTGISVFSIYPYQIGLDNDEAIESGAFWFYRKLGFRPGRADLQELCEREEKRIAADPGYRTSPRVLKRLAEANMFFEVVPASTEPISSRSREFRGGRWDTFSVRNLGLLVNRRMANHFGSDSGKLGKLALGRIAGALGIKLSGWSKEQRRAFENWALVLTEISGLRGWSVEEKTKLIKIIRAKAGSDEVIYLKETQCHSRLRDWLLRAGSAKTAVVCAAIQKGK